MRTRAFLALAFGLSWVVAWPLALASRGWLPYRLHPALHLLVGLGPALAALLVAAREEGGARGFLRTRLRARPRRWLLVGALAPFAVFGLAVAASRAPLALPPLALLFLWPVSVLAFGFGEELGWRGLLLPRVLARRAPLAATLAVAGVWALWHLPLVVDAQAIGKGGAASVARFAVGLPAGAVLLTWLRHRAGGNVLPCALLHGGLNAAATLVADPVASWTATLLLVAAALLALRTRPFRAATGDASLAALGAGG